jgi:hypothetical protein
MSRYSSERWYSYNRPNHRTRCGALNPNGPARCELVGNHGDYHAGHWSGRLFEWTWSAPLLSLREGRPEAGSCRFPGCDLPVLVRGWCPTHDRNWREIGTPYRPPDDPMLSGWAPSDPAASPAPRQRGPSSHRSHPNEPDRPRAS